METKNTQDLLQNNWDKYDAYPLRDINKYFKYYYQVLGSELYDYGEQHPQYNEIIKVRNNLKEVINIISKSVFIENRYKLELEVKNYIDDNF